MRKQRIAKTLDMHLSAGNSETSKILFVLVLLVYLVARLLRRSFDKSLLTKPRRHMVLTLFAERLSNVTGSCYSLLRSYETRTKDVLRRYFSFSVSARKT